MKWLTLHELFAAGFAALLPTTLGIAAMADEIAPPPRAAGGEWSVVIAPQNEAVKFGDDGQVAVVQAGDLFEAPPAEGLPLIQGGRPGTPPLRRDDEASEEAPAPAPQAPEGEGGDLPQIPPGYFDAETQGPTITPNVGAYAAVYRAIPFSRAEYEANPSYRHDATMEFLFGKLRPTVIYKTPYPAPPSQGINYITPYGYTYPGYSPYGYSPNYRGWRGGYGVNYNFWYPMPTVYRHY